MDEKPPGPPPDDGVQPHTPSRLVPLVYDQLRAAAHRLIAREAPGHSLQTTALVHEAYLRLSKPEPERRWGGPSHFSAVLVEVMRRILVESARRKKRLKRGGGMTRQDLEPGALEAPGDDDTLLALDEALTALAAVNASWAELVKLRYFGGLTVPEAARALGVAPRTADAWWAAARNWLKNRLALDIAEVIPDVG